MKLKSTDTGMFETVVKLTTAQKLRLQSLEFFAPRIKPIFQIKTFRDVFSAIIKINNTVVKPNIIIKVDDSSGNLGG